MAIGMHGKCSQSSRFPRSEKAVCRALNDSKVLERFALQVGANETAINYILESGALGGSEKRMRRVCTLQRCLTSASGYVQHRKGPQDYYAAPHVPNRVTGVGKRAAMDEN
jgi:hypothetical protein